MTPARRIEIDITNHPIMPDMKVKMACDFYTDSHTIEDLRWWVEEIDGKVYQRKVMLSVERFIKNNWSKYEQIIIDKITRD